MYRSTVEKKVKKILHEQMGTELFKIVPEAELEDNLHMDDLDKIEVVLALEEEFDINIPDGEYENWVTVEQLVDSLLKLQV